MDKFEKIEPTFVEAIQIGDNVTDILKLGCISGVKKMPSEAYPYEYELFNNTIAHKGDWLVFMKGKDWGMLPDELFKKKFAHIKDRKE